MIYSREDSFAGRREVNKVMLELGISCPVCGYKQTKLMPTGASKWWYECESCLELLKPKHIVCFVYCFYGSVQCPPIQTDGSCCS